MKVNKMDIQEGIREGGKYGDTLFFRFVEEKEDVVTFRFFPRPYNGGDVLTGFTFTVDYSALNGWDDFIAQVVLNPEFIRTYWKKYRNGFAAEKYFFKVVEYFAQDFDDCPYKLGPMNFGRLTMPESVRKHLEVNDVDFGAYEPNK